MSNEFKTFGQFMDKLIDEDVNSVGERCGKVCFLGLENQPGTVFVVDGNVERDIFSAIYEDCSIFEIRQNNKAWRERKMKGPGKVIVEGMSPWDICYWEPTKQMREDYKNW